jgi:hypothetical protein
MQLAPLAGGLEQTGKLAQILLEVDDLRLDRGQLLVDLLGFRWPVDA